MKRGPIILIVSGLALLAFLFYLPLTPGKAPEEAKENHREDIPVNEGEIPVDQNSELSPDQRVDDALAKLQSGELPPMQAILTIRDIADKHPENVKANFTMGAMSIQTGQYEKAIPRFEKVIKADPDNVEAYRMMGLAYLKIGDSDKAKASYEKALELASGEAKVSIQKELDTIE